MTMLLISASSFIYGMAMHLPKSSLFLCETAMR